MSSHNYACGECRQPGHNSRTCQLGRGLRGRRFGLLIAVALDHRDARHRAHWLCSCDCGATPIIRADGLLCGDRTTCGECQPRASRSARVARLHVPAVEEHW